MLWYSSISKSGFRSIIGDDDIKSTGKWLVPIGVPDIGQLWQEIEDAACEGRLLAVKKSAPELRRKIGHDLVCVYCLSSDEATVSETLAKLREINVDGELNYKSDRATFEGREDYLYSSLEFGSPALKPF